MASATKAHWLPVVLSVAVHAALTGFLTWVAYRTLSDESRTAIASPPVASPGGEAAPFALDLPTVGDGILVEEEEIDPLGEPPRITGGDSIAHLDTGVRGQGGDLHVSAPALNLADRDEQLRLSPDLVSRLDRDQLQRLRVAPVRQSWEDRRSTTHPTELTLVATGSRTLLERRAPSPVVPSRGAIESPSAGVPGGPLGASAAEHRELADRPRGGMVLGSVHGAPGQGVLDALAGVDHRPSAPVGSARPDVLRGPVAVAANVPARPKDDVDSDQEVATTLRSLIHSSTSGGRPGEGQGGGGGGGEAGTGGVSGPGAHARPMGLGEGDVFDYWTSDPRLLPYFRRIHARIDPLWANAFPKSALLDLRQGTVILVFTVLADGRVVVSWPPERPSGIDEFDRNCAEAVRRAAPLPPIPRELGVSSVRIRAPFVAANPIVK